MNENSDNIKERSEELVASFSQIFLKSIDQKIEQHFQSNEQ